MSDTENTAKLSIAKKIETALMDDIAMGAIGAGERLDEASLAQRFESSRTPIREALNRLLAQGILVQGEKRGLFVAQYTHEQLAQIFEAMYEIEAICARMASQRLTLLARSNIESAHHECLKLAEQGDLSGYLHANEALHLAIYQATQNPFIANLATDFRRRTGPFRAKKFQSQEDLIASAKSHEHLLQCIFSADSALASESMRSHMTESFMQILAAN